MGKWCLHASLFLGNKDMFKNYKRFDFWHVQTADIGGTKPWKNNCSLIWKLFKFLMTLLAGLFEMRGCWHNGLRWAIVALWATCFVSPHSHSKENGYCHQLLANFLLCWWRSTVYMFTETTSCLWNAAYACYMYLYTVWSVVKSQSVLLKLINRYMFDLICLHCCCRF